MSIDIPLELFQVFNRKPSNCLGIIRSILYIFVDTHTFFGYTIGWKVRTWRLQQRTAF